MKKFLLLLLLLTLIISGRELQSYATHTGSYSMDTLLTRMINPWMASSAPESEHMQDVKTHPWLTMRSIQLFEETYSIALPDSVKQQIIIGSIEEDFDIQGTSTVTAYTNCATGEILGPGDWDGPNVNRAENHFMIREGDQDGLTDGTLFGVDTSRNTSAMVWALEDTRNNESYPNAKSAISSGNIENAWRKIGHVLHLIQDMTSPAHVRNDVHIYPDAYEDNLKRKDLPALYQLVGNDVGTPFINNDLKVYFNSLSLYTRSHYFSDDTVFKNSWALVSMPVASVSSENNMYLYGLDSEGHERRIAMKGFIYWNEVSRNPGVYLVNKDIFRIFATVRDDGVTEDIFSDLGPKAIQYGAGIIKRFYDETTGFIEGTVKDAVTQNPLPGVSVKAYSGGTLIQSTQTDASGTYKLQAYQGGGYSLEFSKTGYLTSNYSNIQVNVGASTFLEAVLQIDSQHMGPGNISGTILNALSGVGVAGINVTLRSGINSRTGAIISTTTTDLTGQYAFSNIMAGNYTAELSGSGYVTGYFSVISIGGVTTQFQNGTITPNIPVGELRIILTWGNTPFDLDSHLTGPLPDGSRFHMYFPLSQANGGSSWLQYVTLDLDDVSSFGPETTTIYQQLTGVYRFSVHDFSNLGSLSSFALSNSNATVVVYRGSTLVSTFHVPSNRGGTLWTVFEMSGSTITPINTMMYESDSSNVRSPSRNGSYSTDMELIRNLPPK